MRKAVYEVLKETASKAKKEKRAEVLQQNDHPALRIILAAALHPDVKWDLPETDPPYTPNELEHDQEGVLYNEIRRLYLFLKPNHVFKDHNPNLTPQKREMLFVQLLEMVSREDAELLLAAKHKKLPFKISSETVELAFPGLISWRQ